MSRMSRSPHVRASITAVTAAVIAAAAITLVTGCNDDEGFTPATDGAVVVDAPADGVLVFPDASYDLPTTVLVTPANQQLTVETGKPVPTVQYVAKMGGKAVTATWRLDKGELGTISGSGLFTPSGQVGGEGQISATVGSLKGGTTVKVLLKMSQNGLTKQNGNPGPGGFGGVGGEGLGPAVSATIKTSLDAPPKADAKLKLLYPYNETVWPLGLLAPLLQWSALSSGNAEGVRIELNTTYFSFVGYFGRPAALAAGAPFVRHPLPQDVWKAATRSAAGKTMTVKVVVAAGSAGYGPLTQTWTIANGALRGTVYYQSYGTNLAKNYAGALGVPGGMFGGATLAIKGGSADPVLVAGKSGGAAQCRVCHSVSADGSRMVVQHGDNYQRSSSYDLLKGFAEAPYPASTNTKLGWVGMTPDGSLGLSNAVPIPGGANSGATTALFDMTTGAALTASGLTSFVTHAGFPMFSPSGKLVAFNFYAGPGDTAIGAGDGSKLVVMDFDATTKAFSNPRQLYKGTTSARPGWPAFWPTNKALLFQRELAGAKEFFATRNGGKGELWWVDLATGKAQALNRLNGKTAAGTPYLPTGPSNHDKDAELNYEPTVSPIASGGYAWVVLTSRRLYGNVATIDPWASDPRNHDLTKTPTPKKLWVAALDLNPQAGSDPSHPAFYLPAQELLAGNTRGFWVADPCKPDGQPCEGGDECCGGYCTQQGGTGPLVCGKALVGCAKEFDKCVQSTDCCDYPKFQCVNGHCARWKIN